LDKHYAYFVCAIQRIANGRLRHMQREVRLGTIALSTSISFDFLMDSAVVLRLGSMDRE
jgi:hypothetical protein